MNANYSMNDKEKTAWVYLNTFMELYENEYSDAGFEFVFGYFIEEIRNEKNRSAFFNDAQHDKKRWFVDICDRVSQCLKEYGMNIIKIIDAKDKLLGQKMAWSVECGNVFRKCSEIKKNVLGNENDCRVIQDVAEML